MKNLGISNKIVHIFNRAMEVKIGNDYSEKQNIPSNIPWESVLRP